MKKKRLIDLRLLTKLSARQQTREVTIGASHLALPIELWWNLFKPQSLVLRYGETDLYIMGPTGVAGERPCATWVSRRGTRRNIHLSAYRRRSLIQGRYRPQMADVDGLRAVVCEGAVDARFVV